MTANNEHFYKTFQPSHYDLYIDVNRGTKVISGRTTISGEAKATEISVHQKYLTITSVTDEAGEDLAYTVDNEHEAIRVTLREVGPTALTITYTAPLTDTMMGIYPSYYEVAGEKKQIIGTQFETTFARQAFPSIDEPEAKATFDLALKFDEQPGEIVLANMPELREEDGVHYFATTVRMPKQDNPYEERR